MLSLKTVAASATAADKIAKIGVLAPMTGGAAADGEETLRGVQLAVDEINAAGGEDTINVKTIAGHTFVNAGADSDTINVSDTVPIAPGDLIGVVEQIKAIGKDPSVVTATLAAAP